MTARFTASYPVRFGEIDHAGVMYYPAIFDRIHRAFEDFWPVAVGKTFAEVLAEDGLGFPLVDVQASFRKPFRYGDSVEVGISVLEIGTKSLQFRVTLSSAGEADPRVEAKIVNAVISLESFRPTELPDSYVRALRLHSSAEPSKP